MRTKVVATIGPASDAPETIFALAEAGADVFRLNMAHGTHESHGRAIHNIRAAARELKKPIAILADLAGPKIRIGTLDEPVPLIEGSTIVLAPEGIEGPGELPTTYAELAEDVEPGDRILLDDGILELRVEDVAAPRVLCEVIRGGLLKSNKGINLPGIRVSAPALTDKDLIDLEFLIDADVDYIALSFVQRPEDLFDLRKRIPNGPLIVAKIEKDTALDDIEAILGASDAVMVARGDLGVELPFEQVPIAQKRIIHMANLFGRPVITATQMLESMIESPRPTRAETSDVANAVFDGTDAVMLSGETAAGRFPLLAVEAMVRIAGEIERSNAFSDGPKYDVPVYNHLPVGATPTEHAIAAATVEAVRLLGAPAIVCLTRSGFTARLVSSYRPPVPIIAASDQERTFRRLAMVWGVKPVRCHTDEVTYESLLECARHSIIESGLARRGDRVVVTAGYPFHVSGTTNMIRIEVL